jgi:hypothetical protein
MLSLLPQRLDAQQPGRVELDPPRLELPLASTPSAGASDERYWIVSSRNCPQELKRMQNCRLDVWSVDAPRAVTEAAVTDETSRQARRCALREAAFQTLTPGIPVCIFVHGSYVDRERVLRYSRQTFRWLRQARPEQPLQFIFYTWPSDPITYLPQADFNELSDRAAANGFYLARVIHHIPVECPISMIGHSQGAGTALSTMHLLGGGRFEGYSLPAEADRGHRVRLVMAAAAVDQGWLNPGERYGAALPRTEALLNLVNRRDWALGFYHLRSLDSGRAVSRFGFRTQDYLRMGPLAQRIHQLDVTNTIGRNHTWPNYYSTPALARSISGYVYFNDRNVRQPVKVLAPPEPGQTRFAGGGETFQRAVSK